MLFTIHSVVGGKVYNENAVKGVDLVQTLMWMGHPSHVARVVANSSEMLKVGETYNNHIHNIEVKRSS